MEGYRTEHDTMGEVRVPADAIWGAQTQRSKENFPFRGAGERMPDEIISAFGLLKEAAARANLDLRPEKMSPEKCDAIVSAARRIAAGEVPEAFPLVIWQTGSGTQTNMNVNEVIAHLAARDGITLHPNDDVNLSQSSNDTFPTAIRVAAVCGIETRLLPAVRHTAECLRELEEKYRDVIKCGRTHLQDAVPMRFSQEISGWRSALERDAEQIRRSLDPLRSSALGGTAVGTGLNAPKGFDSACAAYLTRLTGTEFRAAENKFCALTSLGDLAFAHGAIRALAADAMKIANDIRFLASGPRLGLGEIRIPENEPGSSIMPGKVNPTQCEQVTMVAVQVAANDTAVSMCASQGNFQLNVFLPVCAASFLRSVSLLSDSLVSFTDRCLKGLEPDRERMRENVERSLMTVTALTPVIGYEQAAKVAKKAHAEGTTLREACLALGLLDGPAFDAAFHPERMAGD